MKEKVIDSHFTAFWGVFLNLNCNLNCHYCIQRISLPSKPILDYETRTGKVWVDALNAIAGRRKKRLLRLPRIKKLSILGGEPTIFPDFLYVINPNGLFTGSLTFFELGVALAFQIPIYTSDCCIEDVTLREYVKDTLPPEELIRILSHTRNQ